MTVADQASPKPGMAKQKSVIDKAALQRRLKNYYQLECVRPTSERLQLFLDEFLRKAEVNPEIDHRAESSGNH